MKRSAASPLTKPCLPDLSDNTVRRERTVFAVSCAVLLLLSFLSLTVGSYPITVRDLVSALTGQGDSAAAAVFFRLRLPRVVAGICVGAVLGVTGAVCQTVFDSPLASPDLTGVASGASVGAAVAVVTGISSGWGKMGLAFVSGLCALGFLLLLVRIAGGNGTTGGRRGAYLLAGIFISAAADALLMVLKILADPERELAAIEYWTMGSLAAMTWDKALAMLSAALPALVLLFLFSYPTLILSRGADGARGVGVDYGLWSAVLLILSTWAVAAVVSAAGVVGFAGLTVPHIAMLLYRRRGGLYFALCAVLGGGLIVLSDMLARSAVKGAELPLGIFCIAFALIPLGILMIRSCRSSGTGGGDVL